MCPHIPEVSQFLISPTLGNHWVFVTKVQMVFCYFSTGKESPHWILHLRLQLNLLEYLQTLKLPFLRLSFALVAAKNWWLFQWACYSLNWRRWRQTLSSQSVLLGIVGDFRHLNLKLGHIVFYYWNSKKTFFLGLEGNNCATSTVRFWASLLCCGLEFASPPK